MCVQFIKIYVNLQQHNKYPFKYRISEKYRLKKKNPLSSSRIFQLQSIPRKFLNNNLFLDKLYNISKHLFPQPSNKVIYTYNENSSFKITWDHACNVSGT